MALVKYTLLRVLVFAVVAALSWLVGLRGFWLLLVAVFVSGLVSIVVLRRSRDEVSTSLSDRMSTIRTRLDDRTHAEDAWDDARRSDDQDAGPQSDDAGRPPSA